VRGHSNDTTSSDKRNLVDLIRGYGVPWHPFPADADRKTSRHHNAVPIMLTNLFFGWTFIGWIGALIWAHTSLPKEK
jgi:hypothetical protein